MMCITGSDRGPPPYLRISLNAPKRVYSGLTADHFNGGQAGGHFVKGQRLDNGAIIGAWVSPNHRGALLRCLIHQCFDTDPMGKATLSPETYHNKMTVAGADLNTAINAAVVETPIQLLQLFS